MTDDTRIIALESDPADLNVRLIDLEVRPSFRRLFGKGTVAALVIAVLLIGGGTAWGYQAFGVGLESCGAWTTAKEEKSSKQPNYYNWIGGYLTAYNRWVESESGPVSKTKMRGVAAWIDNYCRDNPLEVVATAAERLIYAIEAK